MPATQAPARPARCTLKRLLSKALILVTLGILFGWVYARVSPTLFPRELQAGFKLGVAHGALMPMALPSLVIGQDVEIYATHNAGRAYKLGYIVGINICGLVFFGSAFWRPTQKSGCGVSSPPNTDYMNQPR